MIPGVEITARRMVTFNIGKYEQHVTDITITGIPGDTDPEDIALELDLLMSPEVVRAELATAHDPEDNATSLYTWRRITEKAKEGVNA